MIRVVIVEEDHDWYPFFSTDPNATAVEIIEAFADRATIEQDFHDVASAYFQRVRRQQVVYIDDRAMFVEVARGLGIHGIHHTDYECTRSALACLGLTE